MNTYAHLELSALAADFPADSILSRTVFGNDQLKTIFFAFAPGQELSGHTASMPAIIHILSGEAGPTVGSDASAGRPGTWVHMPALLPHSVLARTPVTMLLLMLKGSQE